ncbi:MAG: 3'-5' exonuclease [Bacteroidia bacterium]|nr:3'-5' exonuclease [Bacteroidia bacterium]
MLDHISLKNILFLDIETVPIHQNFNALTSEMQELWSQKTRFLREKGNPTAEEYYNKAGIYAEFGKIICISTGYLRSKNEKWEVRIKSFYNDVEADLLTEFASMLDKHFNTPDHVLCGHNSKEFDFPFIARRMLINGIKLPDKLNIAGKKPWEVSHLDTMELWKFGDYKSFTSLNLLANIFNIPTPKDDIDGSVVGRVYWEEKDLDRIVNYCQKDVETVAQLLLKFKGEPIIDDINVAVV